jgi:ATP/maltotriose-dependent transcriptional regulator MalT
MLLAPAIYLGRAEAWLTAFDEYAGLIGPGALGGTAAFAAAPRNRSDRAVCLAQLGRLDEARALVGPLLDEIAASSGDDERPLATLIHLLQAAVAVDHRAAARVLVARLDCVAHLAFGETFYTCVGRHLGEAALLLGERAAAHAYYARALEAAGKIRFRPELALAHVSLADLLLQEGDEPARSEARGHLDVAIPELRDMKMQPALERALALADTLEPAVAPARQSASDVLTPREREIAGLMSDGLSNHDIAERLVISEGTVEVHVKHILGKLGFRSRVQVAGWFVRHESG